MKRALRTSLTEVFGEEPDHRVFVRCEFAGDLVGQVGGHPGFGQLLGQFCLRPFGGDIEEEVGLAPDAFVDLALTADRGPGRKSDRQRAGDRKSVV